ncbi:MAG: hypothetical protein JXQ73_29965 [Phycisphaerae bacterium]|nr:hypothetical protein [Phycisphaerae bacterium]
MTVAKLAGWITSAAVGLPAHDRMTFAVVFATRHVVLGSAVAVTLLGCVDYAAFGVVYFVTEVPLLLALVALHRRRQPRSDRAPYAEPTQ